MENVTKFKLRVYLKLQLYIFKTFLGEQSPSTIPSKFPSGLHATRVTDIDGSLTIEPWRENARTTKS